MSKKPVRIWLYLNYDYIEQLALEGPLSTAIAHLKQIESDAKKIGFKELYLYAYLDNKEGYNGYYIRGKRLETDIEYNSRCKKKKKDKEKAKLQKIQSEINERAEYERLKAKFEPRDSTPDYYEAGRPNW